MDQRFAGEEMQDPAADQAPVPVEDALDQGDEDEAEDEAEDEGEGEDYGEGLDATEGMETGDGMELDALLDEEEVQGFAEEDEGEDALADADSFAGRDLGDGVVAAGTDGLDALEEVLADALGADDHDAFLGRLIRGIGRMAGVAGRGATRRVPGGTRTVGPSAAAPTGMEGAGLQALLGQLLPLLHGQAADEMELFEDLADGLDPNGMDAALPVLAGVAIRAAVGPVIRRTGVPLGHAVGRQLVRGMTQAARALTRRQGPQAVRALPRIAASIGRTAARRGLGPADLPAAVRRTLTRVTTESALVRRLAGPSGNSAPGLPRRFVVRGPVQIVVRR